jgi:hypothetical protein
VSRWLSEQRETYVLGLLRVGFALLLFGQLSRRALELWRGGYFGDVFHMPLVPAALVPSAGVYGCLLGAALLGCALSALGVFARPALFGAAALGLFCTLCDRLQYHNNRYQLLLLAMLVAVTPCDRSFSLVRTTELGPGPRWGARLVAFQVSIVYLASSLGKLFDADWRGGAVLRLRFAVAEPYLADYVGADLARACTDVITHPAFAALAATIAISSELFLAVGPWLRRTRILALWLGVVFHVSVELFARVELFSYTMLCSYLVFVTPELRERRLSWDTSRRIGRRFSRLFQRVDLLQRFEHEQSPTQPSLLETSDRDGERHQGLAAWRELARAVPPLFPLWLPLRLLTLRRRR